LKDLERELAERPRAPTQRSRTSEDDVLGDRISIGPDGPKGPSAAAGAGAAGTTTSTTTTYDSETTQIRIKEINDKWKLDVEKLENEKVPYLNNAYQ
uniref:Pre-mRNA-splicing factor SLU7 n=1 Tax=Anisakis simplex TaxID=6269 RepID=A0A0M3KKQ5_ANISI